MTTHAPDPEPSPVESAVERQHAADLRDDAADRRDQSALMRDVAAARRDRQADERDLAALLGEAASAQLPMSTRSAASHAQAVLRSATARRDAAGDRGHAARDRQAGAVERTKAEDDRDTASGDRGQATIDLTHASLDGLTGVYTRSAGLLELQREVDRARRSAAPLSLVFVDVDGLKAVNDAGGHAAGDRVLERVAAALLGRLRPYDLVVRYGGDEFLCALAGMGSTEAGTRMGQVNTVLSADLPVASVSIGVSDLRTDDTLDGLIARADDDLYRGRAAYRSR